MAERRKSLKTLSAEEEERERAYRRRCSDLSLMTHKLRGAMAGKGGVRVALKSGAELAGAPVRMEIDKSLEGRASNLMIYMGGFSFPMDDVLRVER